MTSVYKGQPTGRQIIADLNLVATETFPSDLDSTAGIAAHDKDAAAIVEELLASLPGGTIDRVLLRLLEFRASLLRVRWPA